MKHLEHPVISQIERDGRHRGAEDDTVCPVCSSSCSYVYYNRYLGEYMGCDECIKKLRADEFEINN